MMRSNKGNRALDLEGLRMIFQDRRVHIALAVIKQLDLASDNTVLRVLVSMLPEEREMVARMTWEDVGPSSGQFSFPAVNDLVLIAMADGDEDQCFVIRRLTTKDDKIPTQAVSGDLAIVSKSGKKIWITSADKIYLSQGATAPTQPFVLGTELKSLLSSLLEKISTHQHVSSAPGAATSPPMTAAEFTTLKASPVDDGAILSELVFGE